MIMSREQIGAAAILGRVPDLIDTARAYHDLRDAVLAEIYEFEGDNIIGAAYVVEQFRAAVESVGAR